MAKNLVLYFSVYGTTKKVAEEIARQTGADIVRIEPVIEYDSDRDNTDALSKYAEMEYKFDRRPAIKNDINIEDYDNIFIGYPLWWYTFPMIIRTLFDKYDFAGKTIAPFNTQMGKGDPEHRKKISEFEPEATVVEGLSIEMAHATIGAKRAVEAWLGQIGITE